MAAILFNDQSLESANATLAQLSLPLQSSQVENLSASEGATKEKNTHMSYP